MNPYVIVAGLLALAAASGAGYWKGHHDAAMACEVQRAEDRQAAQKQKDAEAAKAFSESKKVEVNRAQAKIIYRTITQQVDHVVERPVYRNICFDVDGLRHANSALAGTRPDSGQPDVTVPSAGSAR